MTFSSVLVNDSIRSLRAGKTRTLWNHFSSPHTSLIRLRFKSSQRPSTFHCAKKDFGGK